MPGADFSENIVFAKSIAAAGNRTTTTTGVSVDLYGYEEAIILIGVDGWTDGTHTFSLTESDDNSSFTAVAAGDILGTMPVVSGAGGAKPYRNAYRGTKRYIKIVNTVTGAPATGAIFFGYVGKVCSRTLPVTQP